tara:strand:- start:100 stop:354 length:255 start_codon:yes stop_codon:yes gene_type:complete
MGDFSDFFGLGKTIAEPGYMGHLMPVPGKLLAQGFPGLLDGSAPQSGNGKECTLEYGNSQALFPPVVWLDSSNSSITLSAQLAI